MTDSITMRERFAAQSVIEELLHCQESRPPRSFLGRLFGASPLCPESEPWYRGAKGELAVASLLTGLPHEWTVFHALPVGSGGYGINHLVVGPGGVFTINTRHYSGQEVWVAGHTMLISGRGTNDIRNAELEASRVGAMLRERMPMLPPVQPVIALVGAKHVIVRARPRKVRVIEAGDLVSWLTNLVVVMNESELDLLVDILDEPSTWQAAPVVVHPEVWDKFAVLDHEVRSARFLRAGWTLAGMLALVGASVSVLPLLLQSMAGGLLP
ncbi:nuclease-related domain-containing protein [Cryobacterium tepidiphilum]|uniref:nuclease-related domain-containing protein n=1 Tax=Cryobacterium tepidiphilum TaxID=2486026 RepID=UPI001313FB3F|nr:nuclease-related domain-containing protein [Cryobacterium tepidiphilum]